MCIARYLPPSDLPPISAISGGRTLAPDSGHISEVAPAISRTRMQVHCWMERFAIDPEAHRDP